MAEFSVIRGDCREVLPMDDPECVDAVITDPPYHLTDASRNGSPRKPGTGPFGRHRVGERGFMGKTWDGGGVAFDPETWAAVHRVLKPGGRLLAFGAPRTHHRIWCAIEDAGFVIEDTVMWLFGSGYPKHRSKMKPAFEPICIARKGPVSELNIDAGRVNPGTDVPGGGGLRGGASSRHEGWARPSHLVAEPTAPHNLGRWPANVALSHHEDCEQVGTRKVRSNAQRAQDEAGEWHGTALSGSVDGSLNARRSAGYGGDDGRETVEAWHCHPDCPVRLLDEQSGESSSTDRVRLNTAGHQGYHGNVRDFQTGGFADSGGASRFFYTSKASRAERDHGLEGAEPQPGGSTAKGFTDDVARGLDRNRPVRNHHATVKPVDLMRWLVRLTTQPGALVLDPFCGSGSTGVACMIEGRRFVGIEIEPEYVEIARRRVAAAPLSLFAEPAS